MGAGPPDPLGLLSTRVRSGTDWAFTARRLLMSDRFGPQSRDLDWVALMMQQWRWRRDLTFALSREIPKKIAIILEQMLDLNRISSGWGTGGQCVLLPACLLCLSPPPPPQEGFS